LLVVLEVIFHLMLQFHFDFSVYVILVSCYFNWWLLSY